MYRTNATFPTTLLVLLFAAAPLLAGTVELLPVKDNTLFEPISKDGFVDVSNGAGKHMFTGKTKDAETQSEEVAVRRAYADDLLERNLMVRILLLEVFEESDDIGAVFPFEGHVKERRQGVQGVIPIRIEFGFLEKPAKQWPRVVVVLVRVDL